MKQLLILLTLLASLLVFWLRADSPVNSGAQPVSAIQPQLPAGPVVISMLYSPAKQAWVEWARDQYVRTNPGVQVKLTAMGSVVSIDAILLGNEKPTVWSPESLIELGDLAERWPKQTGRSLYASDPEYAPESLLRTPVVLLAWESRAKVLDAYLRKHDGDQPRLWKRLIEATVSREGWKGLDGPAEWGAVKFAYTDPFQTGIGLWTLYLACLDELHGPPRFTADELDDPGVIELLRSAAASPLTPLATEHDLIQRMEQFGPGRYDLAVTYETLALKALETPKERWERLVIYYPPRLVWSDHPAVVLELPENSEQQEQAGLRWIRYLKSHAAQLAALRYGFRPADEAISLFSQPADNPFVAHSRGMSERLEREKTAIVPPEGPVVAKLLQTARNAYGRLE